MKDEIFIMDAVALVQKIEKDSFQFTLRKIQRLNQHLGKHSMSHPLTRLNNAPSEYDYAELKTILAGKHPITMNNQTYKRIYKQNLENLEKLKDAILKIAEDPQGSLLPQNNTKQLENLSAGYQYRIGKCRLIWRWSPASANVRICDFGTKNQIIPKLKSGDYKTMH